MKTVFPAFALSCTLLLSLASCSGGQSSAPQEDQSTSSSSASSMSSGSVSQANDQDTALEQDVSSLLSAFSPENVRVEQTDARLSVSAFDPEASAAVTAAQESGSTAPDGWADYEAAWAADYAARNPDKKIGIITPFVNQKECIQQKLKEKGEREFMRTRRTPASSLSSRRLQFQWLPLSCGRK